MATNGGVGPNPVDVEVSPDAFVAAHAEVFVEKVDADGQIITPPDLNTNHGELTQNFVEDAVRGLQARDARLVHAIGTDLVPANFAISAGWGTLSTKSVDANSRDARGVIEIITAGVGFASSPLVTLTFVDGAFDQAPFASGNYVGGTGDEALIYVTPSTTVLFLQYRGLPVVGEIYRIGWMLR